MIYNLQSWRFCCVDVVILVIMEMIYNCSNDRLKTSVVVILVIMEMIYNRLFVSCYIPDYYRGISRKKMQQSSSYSFENTHFLIYGTNMSKNNASLMKQLIFSKTDKLEIRKFFSFSSHF